eukprot:TRINITY_DN7330_c0_g1_i1.p1 TRINITY_DN7330_c0_g1~~TRINITY_DN7330_c0_g1_i1.p1  ORF type:complete len:230 (+),score=58.57 TRINITY_DN7330_c0_g1_i1:142-831(+)
MEEGDSHNRALNVVNKGRSWLKNMLMVPKGGGGGLDGLEGGSPDFSVSPWNYNVIKRGSLTTPDLHPGALLGYDGSKRRESDFKSDFKSIEDYSTELAQEEFIKDKKNDDLLLKLDEMSATLKEYDIGSEERSNKSDEDIFSLDINAASYSPEDNQVLNYTEPKESISRFLPNNWLFAKASEEETEDENVPKSRKTSDGTQPSTAHGLTNKAKKMLERRELNVFVPQGM